MNYKKTYKIFLKELHPILFKKSMVNKNHTLLKIKTLKVLFLFILILLRIIKNKRDINTNLKKYIEI